MKLPFIALLLSLSLLVPSIQPAFAQTAPQMGTLIKGSGTPVYWYSNVTRRRHVFPNMNTFYTWFTPHDFYRINNITDAELAALPLGPGITYRPATRLIKITTDPKVYVVERNSTLRWIETEALAITMYGPRWQQFIDDVPDGFFVNYTTGRPLRTPADFAPQTALTPEDILR
jgi:hypothetical protein